MDEKVEWDVKRNVFPFQSDVGLSFNYWISHNEGLEALQIADVVASILHGQPSEVLSGVMAAEKVVIVAAHAVSQDDLRRYLSSCAFLSSCSSMPTLFVQRDSLLVNAEKAHSWFYNDTRVMNATLLWPSIPRTVGKRDSTFLSLIGKHLLTLSSSDDFVTFLSDEAARSTLKTIVDTVRSDCMAAYEHLPAFSREMRQESVVGYCQRHRSPESGLFIADEGSLLIVWNQGGLVSLQCQEDGHFREATDKIVTNQSPWTIHSMIQKEDMPIWIDEVEEDKEIEIEELSTEVGIDKKVELITRSLEEEIAALLPYHSHLPELVLSSDLLTALGFLPSPMHTRCKDTSSADWWRPMTPASLPPSSSSTNSMDLEDGEEAEEADELSSSILLEPVNKLASQARKYFVPLPTGLTLPLDICALDCEMCSTRLGLEITRVTVVHPQHGIVFDTLIRPVREIVDYHTEFSGITQESLANITVVLDDVHEALRKLISSATIIVGHSLDCDLRALHLVHRRIVDTSALFPHPQGVPYRHALKKLAKDYLGQEIQDGDGGHDSAQDAFAALALALFKARELKEGSQGSEQRTRASWLTSRRWRLQQPRYSLFEHILTRASEKSLNVVTISSKLLPRPTWESFSLGYRDDCNVKLAIEAIQEKPHLARRLHARELQSSDWLSALQLLKREVQGNEQLLWCDFALSPIVDTNEPVGPASKRPRIEGSMPCSSSPVVQLDQELAVLYAQCAPGTAIVVLTQDDMLPLRLLIAKKIRNKWVQAKKGCRIPLPGEKEGRLSVDWTASEDEPALLQAADNAAKGCLFIKFKP